MHLLVDNPLEVPQLLLHAVRQGGVVEAQAEFDVTLFNTTGEARAAHQQEAVVDAPAEKTHETDGNCVVS